MQNYFFCYWTYGKSFPLNEHDQRYLRKKGIIIYNKCNLQSISFNEKTIIVTGPQLLSVISQKIQSCFSKPTIIIYGNNNIKQEKMKFLVKKATNKKDLFFILLNIIKQKKNGKKQKEIKQIVKLFKSKLSFPMPYLQQIFPIINKQQNQITYKASNIKLSNNSFKFKQIHSQQKYKQFSRKSSFRYNRNTDTPPFYQYISNIKQDQLLNQTNRKEQQKKKNKLMTSKLKNNGEQSDNLIRKISDQEIIINPDMKNINISQSSRNQQLQISKELSVSQKQYLQKIQHQIVQNQKIKQQNMELIFKTNQFQKMVKGLNEPLYVKKRRNYNKNYIYEPIYKIQKRLSQIQKFSFNQQDKKLIQTFQNKDDKKKNNQKKNNDLIHNIGKTRSLRQQRNPKKIEKKISIQDSYILNRKKQKNKQSQQLSNKRTSKHQNLIDQKQDLNHSNNNYLKLNKSKQIQLQTTIPNTKQRIDLTQQNQLKTINKSQNQQMKNKQNQLSELQFLQRKQSRKVKEESFRIKQKNYSDKQLNKNKNIQKLFSQSQKIKNNQKLVKKKDLQQSSLKNSDKLKKPELVYEQGHEKSKKKDRKHSYQQIQQITKIYDELFQKSDLNQIQTKTIIYDDIIQKYEVSIIENNSNRQLEIEDFCRKISINQDENKSLNKLTDIKKKQEQNQDYDQQQCVSIILQDNQLKNEQKKQKDNIIFNNQQIQTFSFSHPIKKNSQKINNNNKNDKKNQDLLLRNKKKQTQYLSPTPNQENLKNRKAKVRFSFLLDNQESNLLKLSNKNINNIINKIQSQQIQNIQQSSEQQSKKSHFQNESECKSIKTHTPFDKIITKKQRSYSHDFKEFDQKNNKQIILQQNTINNTYNQTFFEKMKKQKNYQGFKDVKYVHIKKKSYELKAVTFWFMIYHPVKKPVRNLYCQFLQKLRIHSQELAQDNHLETFIKNMKSFYLRHFLQFPKIVMNSIEKLQSFIYNEIVNIKVINAIHAEMLSNLEAGYINNDFRWFFNLISLNFLYYFSKKYDKSVCNTYYAYVQSFKYSSFKNAIFTNYVPIIIYKTPQNRKNRFVLEIHLQNVPKPYNYSISKVLTINKSNILKPFTKFKVNFVDDIHEIIILEEIRDWDFEKIISKDAQDSVKFELKMHQPYKEGYNIKYTDFKYQFYENLGKLYLTLGVKHQQFHKNDPQILISQVLLRTKIK